MSENIKTKVIVGGAIALLATAAISVVATLSVTSGTSKDTDIVTMKGNTVTVSEFYDYVKTNSSAQQSMLELVVRDVLEEKYGSKVSGDDVQKLYDEQTASLGSNVETALSSYGYTVESFKAVLRNGLLQDYAIEKAAKKELTDEVYQAAYDEYTPEVTAQIIKLDEEAKAKEVLEKASADGADFTQLAKDNSTDTATKEDGGKVTFDSTATEYPTEVKEAIFKLKDGEVGESVVEVVDAYGTTSFYVVKLNEKKSKSEKWEDYKDILTDWIVEQKKSDSAFAQQVIANELTAANVKVKDSAFQSVFSQYITTSSSTSSSSSSSSEASSSESSSSSSEASSSEE